MCIRDSTGAGRPGLVGTSPGFQDVGGRIGRYNTRQNEKTPAGPPHRDVHLTKRWMDALGVDIVCLFPTPMLQLGLHPQIDVEVQLARAYNRWLCERILAGEKLSLIHICRQQACRPSRRTMSEPMRIIDLHCYPNTEPWIRCQGPYVEALAKYLSLIHI